MQLKNLNFIVGLFIVAAIFAAQANAQTKKTNNRFRVYRIIFSVLGNTPNYRGSIKL